MSVSRWDPFQDMHSLREEMNRTFGRWLGREEREQEREQERAPALDVTESSDAYRIDVEVPGLKPEDIKVTVDQGMLTVQGSGAPRRRPASASTTGSSAATAPSAARSRWRATSTPSTSRPPTTTACCG
jgi:HSP20 family molecular chaperone IbpA